MEDRLFTVDEAAQYLRLHPESVRRQVREGKLPHRRTAGGKIRFTSEDLHLVAAPTTNDKSE